MGQTPAKFFPMPTPYGNSPDMGVLAQAKAASPAPLNNFLPLNPQAPPDQTQQPTQGTQSPAQGQLGGQFGNPLGINRYRGNPYGFGGGIQRNMDF